VTRIAWAGLMRVGMVSMGLRPDEFWALTPAEFLLMRGQGADTSGGLSRATLAALSSEFPDVNDEGGGDAPD
jgi:uncharacterized phage protein (TIGR02216 family)